MTEPIRQLEALSYRTLPAVEEVRYDGWVLRWTGHGSRRANSINPIEPSRLPLDEKIAFCEQWYAQRDAPATFRLTRLADPALDGALADRGYSATSPTEVLTAGIAPGTPDAAVAVAPHPDDGWLRTIPGLEEAPSERVDALSRQLTSGEGTTRFASIAHDGVTIAIGLGIDLDGYTTIYNMNTVPPMRRHGHSRAILATLLALGAANGSRNAVLQVIRDNAPAQNLYRSSGFGTAYEYWYREPPT